MEKERILVFINKGTAAYWFRYIVDFFIKNGFYLKAYRATNMIIFDSKVIYFKTVDEVTDGFKASRRNAMYFYNLEENLDNNFKQTIKEIIYGESGNFSV